jgi:molybdopterin/thiamine biosynthesis adenylyltransferase
MLRQLINHSPDLAKLEEEGFVLDYQDGHLIINSIPFVNEFGVIAYGQLISTLLLEGDRAKQNVNHDLYFSGGIPCNKDGRVIKSIVNERRITNQISEHFQLDYQLSAKPNTGTYQNYHKKINTYVGLITVHAVALDASVTPFGNRQFQHSEDSVHHYIDTNSIKSKIMRLNGVFKGHKVAIIGLGGTGSYILDQLAKTPVGQIHLFDDDWFYNNNAFRAPGAASIEDLRYPSKKVKYLEKIYSKMHKAVISHEQRVSEDNIEIMLEYNFVFISIDNGESRKLISDFLFKNGIPFIDVGLGVFKEGAELSGLIRTTFVDNIEDCKTLGKDRLPTEDGENEYATNIQIADLNCINAALAVVRWKKYLNFYIDGRNEANSIFNIRTNSIINEYDED